MRLTDVHIDMKQIRAWVPDDVSTRPWEDAVGVAIDWVTKQARELASEPLLISNTLQNGRGIPRLDAFAERYGRAAPTAPRSYGVNRSVLAFVPSESTLAFAQEHAQRAALCVVETASTPLVDWAAEVGAEDLTRPGHTVQPTLDRRVREALDYACGFGGNNGWAGEHEKKVARQALGDFAGSGLLDRDAIVGYVLAKGVPEHGLKNIRKLVEQLDR